MLFAGFDTVVTLDTETTGIDCRACEIIELAALKITADGRREDMDALIRLPEGRRLPADITRLTGITDAMLQSEGVAPREAAERFAALISDPGTLLCAYNAQFDLCFLFYFLNSLGLAGRLKGLHMLDAMTIYKDRRDYPHKLSDAVAAYALEGRNTHRAIDDASAAWELLRAMEAERPDAEKYINLFGFNPKYGVSGPRISSITYRPQGYDRRTPLYDK